MAKSRMTSQEIAEDSKVARLSDEAALTYAFTIPFLDRDGLCSGKPSWIAGRALQERPHLQHKAGTYIGEWVTQGLVIRYEGNDGAVLFFPGFRKHNANMPYERETRSKFPPPPGFHRTEQGLIPDDPELAGRLAEAFDTRSLYYKALTEATEQNLHKKVMTSSRPNRDHIQTKSRPRPDQVDTNGIEVEQQIEVEEEENNNSALRALTLAEAETAVVVVGIDSLLTNMDDGQVMALLSWLWLYNSWNSKEWGYRDLFRRAYKSDPFDGMRLPGAVMVARAKEGTMAPLLPEHRDEMMAALEPAPAASPDDESP